jgi:hypothetical protein
MSEKQSGGGMVDAPQKGRYRHEVHINPIYRFKSCPDYKFKNKIKWEKKNIGMVLYLGFL